MLLWICSPFGSALFHLAEIVPGPSSTGHFPRAEQRRELGSAPQTGVSSGISRCCGARGWRAADEGVGRWPLRRPGVTAAACKEEGCPVKPPVVGTLLIAARGSTSPGQACSLKNDSERFGPLFDWVSSQVGAEMPCGGVRRVGALLQHVSFLQREKRCSALKRCLCGQCSETSPEAKTKSGGRELVISLRVFHGGDGGDAANLPSTFRVTRTSPELG